MQVLRLSKEKFLDDCIPQVLLAQYYASWQYILYIISYPCMHKFPLRDKNKPEVWWYKKYPCSPHSLPLITTNLLHSIIKPPNIISGTTYLYLNQCIPCWTCMLKCKNKALIFRLLFKYWYAKQTHTLKVISCKFRQPNHLTLLYSQ